MTRFDDGRVAKCLLLEYLFSGHLTTLPSLRIPLYRMPCRQNNLRTSRFARVQSSIAPAQRCLVTRPMNMASPGSTEPSVETVAARVASTVTRDPVSREIGTGSSSAEQGLARLPWQADGYLSWQYDGHKVNYVDEGDKNKVKTICQSFASPVRPSQGNNVDEGDKIMYTCFRRSLSSSVRPSYGQLR